MVDTTPTRHPAQTLVIELQVVPHLSAVLAHPPVVGLVRRPVGGVDQGVGVGIYKAALLLQVIVTCTPHSQLHPVQSDEKINEDTFVFLCVK